MIKKIVFDLSEVLIPGLIGIEKRLAEITGKSEDLIAQALGSFPYYEVDNHLEKLLKGEISYQDYRSSFFEYAGLDDKNALVFDQECLRMFESPYAHTQGLLNRLAQSYELYLLSDHSQQWVEHIQNQHQFFKYFKGTVWSYEVGATKKSNAPFFAIIEKYDLTPEQCLFVDDNAKNIYIAAELGFKTVHFLGPQSVDEIYRIIKLD